MWKDPLKIVGIAVVVLILAKTVGAPYLPEELTNYVELVGACLIVLALVLAVMRRRGRL
jgi:hypothetical protein